MAPGLDERFQDFYWKEIGPFWPPERRAREAGQEQVLLRSADDLAGLWRDTAERRPVTWPINMRVGRIAGAWRREQR